MEKSPGHPGPGGEVPHQRLPPGGCADQTRPQRAARGLRGWEGGGHQGAVAVEDGGTHGTWARNQQLEDHMKYLRDMRKCMNQYYF